LSTLVHDPAASAIRPPSMSPTNDPSWNRWDMAKAIIVTVIGTLIAGVIAALAAELLVDSGERYQDDSTAYAITLIPGMVVVELLLLATALWFGPRKHRVSLASLGLRSPIRGFWWLPPVVAIASLILVYAYDAALSLASIEPASTPDEVFASPAPFAVVAVGAVLLAPWIEEIFFRGFLFGGLRVRWGWLLAAVASSLLFALAHLDVYGIPVYAAIGFLFAWSYHHTGALKSSVIAHAMVNFVTLGVGLAASG
jgi:membrane protease YdiL (CAAX protease family)